jgi:hypothetical protein
MSCLFINSVGATPGNVSQGANVTISVNLTSIYNVSYIYASVQSSSATVNQSISTPDFRNTTVEYDETSTIFSSTSNYGLYNVTVYVNNSIGDLVSSLTNFTVYDSAVQTVNIN